MIILINNFDELNVDLDSEYYYAVAYYRLSKEDTRKRERLKNKDNSYESDSIANQRKLINEYVKKHPEIKLVAEAIDDGYTGTNYERPGFRDVMELIESGKVNCVIVKDLSRLGREYIETGKYLEILFPSFGVRFIAINDDVDSENTKASDDFIIPVKNIMNESYCREQSKKLRKQFRIQRNDGEFLGSFASYGYLKSPEDKHKLIIDEYAAEVVKTIFSLKVFGKSQQAIADFLNEEQILPPAEYKKSIGLNYKSGFKSASTGKWSHVTIRTILSNPIYIGTLVQGKRGTPNYKIKKTRVRNESEWSVVENNHEPIIDPLTFFAVQKMLARDTRTSPQKKAVLPLSGVLFCPDCQRAMCRRSVSRGKKKFYYYICSTNKHGKGCSSHNFEQYKLEETVLHAISNQINIVIEMEQLISDIGQRDITATRVRKLDLLIAQKNKDIDGYKDFRMKLYEALSDELLTRDEYNKMRDKYTKQIDEAQAVVDEMNAERAKIIEDSERDNSWMEMFAKFQGIETLSREVVFSLIDKIYVYEDKRIRIDFNYRNELAYYQELLSQSVKEVG